MKYIANPVVVDAFKMVMVDAPGANGDRLVLLDNATNAMLTAEMAARYVPTVGDYWVVQADGYAYINPREVFERKYRPLHTPTSTFGEAIEALKMGLRVCRAGWNGKGMWLAYSPGSQALPAERFWAGPNREYAQANGGTADVLPCITMKTATGEILMGWLASQSDILAEDWMIVP
jgi:hypothetical protein